MIIIRKKTIAMGLAAIAICLAVILVIRGGEKAVQGKIREIPIYSVENDENKVSITFDCAWGALS